jgi:hypothetical protein
MKQENRIFFLMSPQKGIGEQDYAEFNVLNIKYVQGLSTGNMCIVDGLTIYENASLVQSKIDCFFDGFPEPRLRAKILHYTEFQELDLLENTKEQYNKSLEKWNHV